MPPLEPQDRRPGPSPPASGTSPGKPAKLVEVRNLRKHFPIREGILQRVRSHVRAVDGVSFAIERGNTLGLVGESGCGKTTCGRCVTGIHEPTDGQIEFDGQPTAGLTRRQMGARMQIVFQDPYSSLNPRKTIHQILSDPFRIHTELTEAQIRERVVSLLQRVGLEEAHLDRYPYEFSGGQRQRIAIARAIAVHPAFLFLDEPTSALDVSVQGQILNLLRAIQGEFDLAYLFVTHDIQVVKYMADDVAVMYLGKIMETGPKAAIFDRPASPLYQSAVLRDSGAGSGGEVDPYRAAGGDAYAHRPTRRLPVLPAMLDRGPRSLRRRGARVVDASQQHLRGRQPPGRLPLQRSGPATRSGHRGGSVTMSLAELERAGAPGVRARRPAYHDMICSWIAHDY